MIVNAWGWKQARHLLNRAGFGGKPAEIAAFQAAGLEGSLSRLFDFDPRPLPRPSWLSGYNRPAGFRFRNMSREERRAFQKQSREHLRELQTGWLEWMIGSPDPASMLWEKMTFFWHGHFATSFQKVKLPPLLYNQLALFHQHAVGNFRDLLLGVCRDPALLRYLDNNQNRKGKPNENFARELMELFTLGPGHYTEQDVKEAARAFTGWTNDPFQFRFVARQHDYGSKTFLGRTGDFDGEDIVHIILQQPACAEFITRKLLHFFGFEAVSETTVQELADTFRDQDYQLAPLLRKMFSTAEFYRTDNMGVQIKSPIQLVVGTARTLEAKLDRPEFYLYVLDLMGQVPFFPPNVKGWPDGRAWIDTSRLLTRYTFAEILTRGRIPEEIDPRADADPGLTQPRDRPFRRMTRARRFGIEFDPTSLLDGLANREPAAIVQHLEAVLLCHPFTEAERRTLAGDFAAYRQQQPEPDALKALLGDVMTLPAYQLC